MTELEFSYETLENPWDFSHSENEYRQYLMEHHMSDNTINSYLYGLRQFFGFYKQLSLTSLNLYKVYLMEHYRPQTVNLRIRAMNSYLQFLGISDYKMKTVRIQQKTYLDRIISQADYEYLKRRLWEDGEYTFYFIVRFTTATGIRVSELVTFQAEDVKKGYKNIYSKGNKMRRVYIPVSLQKPALIWLKEENRISGPLFLNRFGEGISATGIRGQLEMYACRYGLDPMVVYPHSFRHRFAKNFIEKGGDIALLSNLLGHDSLETTRIYLRRSSTEQAAIFNEVVDW